MTRMRSESTPPSETRADRTATLLVLLGLTAGLQGCLSSNPPLPLRYFEPAVEAIEPVERPELVVDRIVAAPYLDQRMVWRLSDVELAYDERNRWVASPSDLVGAAAQRAIHGSETGASRLRIEVTAFEGIEETGEAYVELLCTSSSARDRTAQHRRFSARAPLDGDRPDDLARAMGKALSSTMRDAARWATASGE